MHERLNSAKYTREEYGRITWRRSSMKKMNLGLFDGRKNEVEVPIEKITWGGDESCKMKPTKTITWGGDEGCKMKPTKMISWVEMKAAR